MVWNNPEGIQWYFVENKKILERKINKVDLYAKKGDEDTK